jgi:hypothetical protein
MRTNGGADHSGEDIAVLLESMGSVPVFARDRHLTVVAANDCARKLSPALHPGSNLLRWLFLGDDEPECAIAPELSAAMVGLLHDSLEQHDADLQFRSLVGELASRNGAFSRIWAGAERSPSHSGPVARTRNGAALRFQELRLIDDYELVVVVLYEAG